MALGSKLDIFADGRSQRVDVAGKGHKVALEAHSMRTGGDQHPMTHPRLPGTQSGSAYVLGLWVWILTVDIETFSALFVTIWVRLQ